MNQRVQGGLLLILGAALLGIILAALLFISRNDVSAWRSRQLDAIQNAQTVLDVYLDEVQSILRLYSAIPLAQLEQFDSAIFLGFGSAEVYLQEIVRLDAQGNILKGDRIPGEQQILFNLFTIPQSRWFLEAQAGRIYNGNLEISAAGEPYIIFSIPGENGEVIAARLKMDLVWNLVDQLKFGSTGQAYLVNQRGILIAHPNETLVENYYSLENQPEFQAALQGGAAGWNGVYWNFQGAQVSGVIQPLSGADWLIFSEVSQAEIYRTTRQAILILGGGLLLFGLLISLITRTFVRREVIQPIQNLRAGAERLQGGDFDIRLNSNIPNELGELAAAFNLMAARLQERQAALEVALTQAQDANRFKSSLLANVSHDLRTPLNGILGFSEILQQGVFGVLNTRQLDATNRIMQNAQRLIDMVNTLLNQAQIESGRIAIQVQPFEPKTLMENMLHTMEPLASKKNLELRHKISPDLPGFVAGDIKRLEQVLINLVSNAVKYTEKGWVEIYFAPVSEQKWKMSVRDTGIGIPADQQARVFQPFTQVDTQYHNMESGFGLGLSIVKQLVIILGGSITLTSEPGQGSTFEVLLPYQAEKESHA